MKKVRKMKIDEYSYKKIYTLSELKFPVRLVKVSDKLSNDEVVYEYWLVAPTNEIALTNDSRLKEKCSSCGKLKNIVKIVGKDMMAAIHYKVRYVYHNSFILFCTACAVLREI